jgi:hypothetical protein
MTAPIVSPFSRTPIPVDVYGLGGLNEGDSVWRLFAAPVVGQLWERIAEGHA